MKEVDKDTVDKTIGDERTKSTRQITISVQAAIDQSLPGSVFSISCRQLYVVHSGLLIPPYTYIVNPLRKYTNIGELPASLL